MAATDDIDAAITNLATAIKTNTAAWVAAGCPIDFSIDGESYSFSQWLENANRTLAAMRDTQQKLAGPFAVGSLWR